MKQKSIFVFGLLLMLLGTTRVYSEEGDRLEKAKRQPNAFPVVVTLQNSAVQSAVSLVTVDTIGEFLLDSSKNSGSIYDLYFFRDGRSEDTIKSITLPYVFKQNFSGLNNGQYKLSFLLINQAGEVGRVDQVIIVQHH